MNHTWKKTGIFVFLFTIPALMYFYPYLNTPERGVHSFVTGLDQAIPVVKVFVIPYAAWVGYISISLIYLCFKDGRLAFKTILVFDLGLLACFMIYYFYQTIGPARPVITGHDPLSNVLKFVYKIDQPYNSFPSIHVMSSYLVARAIGSSQWKSKPLQWVMSSVSASIILATLFIKQHVILDVLGAIILVECLIKAVDIGFSWIPAQSKSLKETARKQQVSAVKTLH